MRVPFIAAWAKPAPANPFQKRLPIRSGAIQGQLASVCDIYPTLLGVAGVPNPAGHAVDGSALDTLLNGGRDDARPDGFLMHYPHEHRSNYFTVFRRGDWKVVYHYFPSPVSNGSHYQLFNLAEDPFEQADLAPTQPAKLREMMQGLIAGMAKAGAVYPVDRDGGALQPLLPPAAGSAGGP